MRHSLAAAGLCLVATTSFSIASAAANEASSSSLLRRTADLDDADIKKLGSTHVPEGPVVLVLGGLGVAFVALIFVVIKVMGSGKATSASRQIMAERAKAKTDLRIKGLSRSNEGTTPSRRAPTSDTPTAVSSPWESPTASRHFFEDYSRRNSHINVLGSQLKGYSPPRGKSAHPESSYNSLSSMVDVPMLMAQGRTNTTFSQDSISSAEGSKMRFYRDAPPPRNAAGPRRPQTQPKPAPNRSSMYRGTDLGVSRKPSTKSHYERSSAVPPAWMDASYESQGPRSPVSELKRHNTDAGEHSRRTSSANLLDDNDIFATPTLNVPTPLFAAAGASSSSASSSDHSSNLQPVSSHPLSKRTMPASADGHAGAALANGYGHYEQQQQYRQPPAPRWAQTAASSPTQQHPSAWAERPRPRPQQAIPAYPSSSRDGGVWSAGLQPRDPSLGSSSGSGGGAGPTRYFDVEQQAAAYEMARPGQFHQQVAPGNGKRGSRGFPAGQQTYR